MHASYHYVSISPMYEHPIYRKAMSFCFIEIPKTNNLFLKGIACDKTATAIPHQKNQAACIR